jgi:hypothetical protein
MTPHPDKARSTFFDRRFDRRVRTTFWVVLVSVVSSLALTLHAAWPTRIRNGYKPEQPIAYPHDLHAGAMQIPCRYCHTGVDTGAIARIPPLSTCMNCHTLLLPDPSKKTRTERLAPLLAHWKAKEPVVWHKVYDLADFAQFHHGRHLSAGVDCINCHGEVRTMAVVQKMSPLTMGWCIECHMGRRDWRRSEDLVLRQMTGAEIVNDPIYGKILAPIWCSTCHR